MERRVKIHEKELKRVYNDLKSEGYTLRNISSKMDSDFRNCLYKGHSLGKEAFDKLRTLYGHEIKHKEIQHVNGKGEPDDLSNLTECPETAELIGIVLGDGHLTENLQHCLCITFCEDEQQLINRTKILCQSTIEKTPKKYDLKGSRAIQLKVHSKELVKRLTELGLQTGDKVENQVEIPSWIKDKEKYQKRCLRGLVDTDGCIYTQSRDSRTIVRFKNQSKPLLTGFKEMCRNLNIKPSNGGECGVQVASQTEVRKFIEKVDPIKSRNTDLHKT